HPTRNIFAEQLRVRDDRITAKQVLGRHCPQLRNFCFATYNFRHARDRLDLDLQSFKSAYDLPSARPNHAGDGKENNVCAGSFDQMRDVRRRMNSQPPYHEVLKTRVVINQCDWCIIATME